MSVPAAAQAADAFVDFETGVDSGTCGPMGSPCKTVTQGITNAGDGEAVRVDETSGSYTGLFGFTLDPGQSLIAQDFVAGDDNTLPEPDTILEAGDPVIFPPTVTVPSGSSGGTIQGFRIRSIGTTPVRLSGSATLTGNTIDEDGGTFNCLVEVSNAGNTSTVGPDNSFIDPTPTATPQTGVCATTSGTPSITANTFTDLNRGVRIDGGNTTVSFNTFTGTQGTINDAAIMAVSGIPAIAGNLIQDPGDADVAGIRLEQTSAMVGGTLRRNQILGHRVGVIVNDTGFPVDLNGDLIAKSTLAGFAINDSMSTTGDANVTATNITVTDNLGQDVSVNNSELTLNSSIIGNLGITPAGLAPTCTISFSRGPTTGAAACTNFQTSAAPGFVNPAADDYHLASDSPLIDTGDPAPAPGILDLDGEARATDGNGDGIARRDIGADETPTVLPTPAITPPGTVTPAAPPTTAVKKRCKKRKKKRSGRAAVARKKKCKRKKR